MAEVAIEEGLTDDEVTAKINETLEKINVAVIESIAFEGMTSLELYIEKYPKVANEHSNLRVRVVDLKRLDLMEAPNIISSCVRHFLMRCTTVNQLHDNERKSREDTKGRAVLGHAVLLRRRQHRRGQKHREIQKSRVGAHKSEGKF